MTKNKTKVTITKTSTIDDVRVVCQDIGDTLKNNFDATGDIKVAATAIAAYNTAIKCATVQLIHKKLTGTPTDMPFLLK
jgi:hypothetical protein